MIKIYVRPLDSNSKYTELDMFEGEVIEMNQINKSDENFDTVYSPFTKEFNVPATGHNIGALIHYFDTQYQKTRKKILGAVITLNGEEYKVGRVAINTSQYVERVSTSITLNFYTSISSLKDKVGNDKLTDLRYNVNSFIWNSENVYRNASGQIPNDDIIIPLISNRRAWNYKGGGSGDIFNDNNAITQDELRPAVRFSKIMDAVLQNYGFDVECPLFDRPEYQNLFVYLNNNSSEKDFSFPIRIVQNFVTARDGNTSTTIPYNNGIRITFNQTVGGYHKCYTQIMFNNLLNVNTGAGWDDNLELEVRIVYAGDSERTFTFTEFQNGDNYSKAFTFELNPQEYGQMVTMYFTLKSEVPLSCDSVRASVFTYNQNTFNSFTSVSSNGNIMTNQSTNFDVSTTISNMKVTDFLSSFFKMFNIRVIEQSSSDYKMTWLTPQDIEDDIIDLTKYVNWNEYEISAPIHYKEITFTHAENSMFRNKQYKATAANKEFGAEIYVDEESDNSETFEVETAFQVMNYFELPDTTLLTSYAWETNGSQYFGSDNMILFYFHGYEIAKDPKLFNTNVNFKYRLNSSQTPVQIAQYAKVHNYDKVSKHSITFDKYIDPQGMVEITGSLFKNYYQTMIENIYGNNSRKFKFNLILPSNVVKKLNIVKTIIIENLKFTVDEIKTDLVSGKTELMLTNIEYRADRLPYNIYPPTLYYAGVNSNSINVVFNGSSVDAPQTIAGHQIRYKRNIDNVWEFIDVPVQANNQISYVVNLEPLYAGTPYTIEVRSYDNLGKYSQWLSMVVSTTGGSSNLPPYKIGIPILDLIGVIDGGVNWEVVTPIIINEPSIPLRPISGVYNIEMLNTVNDMNFREIVKIDDITKPIKFASNIGVGNYRIRIDLEAYDTELVTTTLELEDFEVGETKD